MSAENFFSSPSLISIKYYAESREETGKGGKGPSNKSDNRVRSRGKREGNREERGVKVTQKPRAKKIRQHFYTRNKVSQMFSIFGA